MTETYARDTVGSGPHLNFRAFGEQRDELSKSYAAFLEETKFVALLKTAIKTYLIDGEVFLISSTEAPFYRIVESERIKSPFGVLEESDLRIVNGLPVPGADSFVVEGIRYVNGVAREYCVDGDRNEWFPAEVVTHMYRQDFANQRRGVPRPAPSLDAFAKIRRLDSAVTAAYETVAKIAMVLQAKMLTPSSAGTPFEVIDLVDGSALTLPEGYEIGQIKAEHPTTTHREFATYLIGNAARCFPMPLNKALGTSQDSNFASGSLDNIDYERAITEERSMLAGGRFSGCAGSSLSPKVMLTKRWIAILTQSRI